MGSRKSNAIEGKEEKKERKKQESKSTVGFGDADRICSERRLTIIYGSITPDFNNNNTKDKGQNIY